MSGWLHLNDPWARLKDAERRLKALETALRGGASAPPPGTHSHDSHSGIVTGNHHPQDHPHDGTTTQKLTQADSHQSPDTDTATTSLHHTLGPGANQASAGTHSHAAGAPVYSVPTTKTSAYTAVFGDYVRCDATGGTFTITLPAASGNAGKVVIVKKIDSTANVITVDANASETIDGALTQTLSFQWDALMLICDGTGWGIV